jgi:hypothetical protein
MDYLQGVALDLKILQWKGGMEGECNLWIPAKSCARFEDSSSGREDERSM